MMKFLQKLAALPDVKDDIQHYTARILRVVLGFVALVGAVYTAINIFNDPANSLRYGLQFASILLTVAIMFLLLRAGKPRAASIILVLATWIIFTAAAYTGGGIPSSAYMGYLVVLAMAGLVTANPTWTIFITLLCIASGYSLLQFEQSGTLPIPRVSNDSQSIWLDSIIYFTLVAALQILAAKIVIDALKRARLEGQQKQETEEREKVRSRLLRRVIELGKDVTQAADLDWCLKKIHQSIQKGLGFDRVGLFLYDENLNIIQGTYGTDRQGNLEDISHYVRDAGHYDDWATARQNPDGISFIKNYSEYHQLMPESPMYGIKEHLTLAAWSGRQPVALITVDNAITNEPISDEKVEALQLFAGYAGLAITNARNLEEINHELESFSYSVSHDLRSPLRAVVGFSQILMTDQENQIDSSGMQYLKKINESGKKMGRLIDDLLNFSRIGRQTLRLTTLNLKPIIENITKALDEKYPERRTIWKIAELPDCKADFGMMQQVMTNLIENAFTYTSTTENPEVEIGSLKQNGETVYFVRDNGIGFEMKYAEKIFRVFHRLHHDNEFEGTGVGLAIVQRILQRHGGKIWSASEPGKGATFFFSLP